MKRFYVTIKPIAFQKLPVLTKLGVQQDKNYPVVAYNGKDKLLIVVENNELVDIFPSLCKFVE